MRVVKSEVPALELDYLDIAQTLDTGSILVVDVLQIRREQVQVECIHLALV